MTRHGVLTALILLLSIAIHAPAPAATGTAWDWRVNVIPDQSFDSQQQAEAALRALGDKYAYASVVEEEFVGVYWSTYTYGAKPRGPDIGPWYEYTIQGALTNPHPTEEASIASVVAWGDQNRQSCTGPTVVKPINEWRPWRIWYSGDTYEESRNYTVTFDAYPACVRGSMPAQAWRKRVVQCPAFMTWSSTNNACELHNIATIRGQARVCTNDKVGNPCSASTGNKTLEETDLSLPWISFSRTYQSQISVPKGGFGNHWTHSLNVRAVMSGGTAHGIVTASGHPMPLNSNSSEALDGSGETVSNNKWLRRDGTTRTFYGAVGRLIRDDLPNGQWYTYAYDSFGRLTTATHSSGRALTFIYEPGPASAESRIKEIKHGTTVLLSYEYDTQGNLVLVHRADGTTRQYHYEDPAFPTHLTGVTDENGARFATYAYDAYGRAISSEHAGGAGRVELAYQTDGSTIVTDALGKVATHRFTADGYYRKPLSIAFDGATESWTYPAPATDFRRRPTQFIDRNGIITTYQYSQYSDAVGNVIRTRRIEAFGTPRQRTIDTDRRAGSGQLVKEVAGGKTTSYTYNTRRQIATLTEKDNATSLQRVTTYAYCESVDVLAGCPWVGLLKSVDGPRTDVADVTTFEYDAQGNLYRATNALGHVTTYNSYNAHGQPLTITDPNGILTTLTYDLRQRLTSRTVGSEQTTFDYWPTGLLKKTTLPDGSFLEYTYDAAHRLTGVNDSEGNRIEYTLDAMGNRTAENLYDPTNALTQTRARVFNTLNQLWKEIGSAGTANVTTTFGYDNNGNQTSVAAPLGRHTSQSYDELNRVTSATDPLNGVTQYGYNALDQLISVTDPRSKVTSYSYNALGDLTQQVSPDTGTTINAYDAAGNLLTSTDARNKIATYAYDALNRVTSLTYSDQTIGYTYDSGTNQKGRLTEVTDGSGSTSWTYDAQGRVVSRQQSMGVTKSVGYAYDLNGRLQTLTLPSGNTITYGYTDGKVASLTLNGSTTILTNVLYQPFGPTRGWTWGNSSLAVREYDADGLITDIDSAGLKSYDYDDAFRITDIADAGNAALSQSYGYDLLDRLTSATGAGLYQGWTYDANGSRLAQTGDQPSTYTVSSTNNRLSSISGVMTRSYVYNASGSVTADGTATFTYDDAGRLVSATKAGVITTYSLNALGQRVRKTSGGTSTYFVYDEAGHLVGEYDDSGALIQETVWFGDIPVATIRPGGASVELFYVHADHLNTPRRISRPSDNMIVWRWDSDPFGATVASEDPDGDSSQFVNNLRFPGQYYDAETGMHYNYYRDGYDPTTGRYAQSDPVGLYGGLNTYAYGENSPNRNADPKGLNPAAAAVDGVLLGGVCVVACSAWQPCRDSARNFVQSVRSGPVIDPDKPVPPQLPGYIDPGLTCPTSQADSCPAFREPPSPKDRCVNAVNLRLGACLRSGRSSLLCHTQWVFGLMFCNAKSDDSSHSTE
jgi:RHS repeat-associated protein